MPTLSLIAPAAAHPDASHGIGAPGGYEWWYFDAEDPRTDTQIVAIFLHGFIFHPGYLRSYYRYLRNPTKHSPPLPQDYVCAYFVVYRSGKILHQFMTQYPASQYAASTSEPDVTIGENRMTLGSDGALELSMKGTPWSVTGRGPVTRVGETLKGSFRFAPRLPHPPQEKPFFSKQLAGAEHHWVVANPLCDVDGAITLEGNGRSEQIEFSGKGYHDHNYGLGPIGPGLRRWFWGRVLLDGKAVTFHYAEPRDRTLANELHLLEADGLTSKAIDVTDCTIDFSKRTVLGLKYPATARFDDVLELSEPRVVDSAPFYMRLVYKARVRGDVGTAFCEVAYPHRLRWPVLGRMIEMSIDKRK